MRRATIAALLLTTAIVVVRGQDRLAHPAIDLKGHIYRAVFVTSSDVPTRVSIAGVPPELASRIERFLDKYSAIGSEGRRQDGAAGDDERKQLLARAIVALLDRDDAAALAEAFLEDAPVADDWGHTPDAPLREAAYAEKRLTPSDPLAPFLYVFIAQRQRAAFEAAERAQDIETMKAAAKKYRAVMQRARSTADPIFALLADDLDRMPYVSVPTAKHPATFNPDT
jgi:hypothetical protein